MFLANLFAADRNRNAAKAKSRRRHLALDCLEERKVLSTATTNGSFDNMAWVYSYDNVAKAGTLTITDRPDGHTIHIDAAHPDLSPGDPGYSPAHVNDITGIQLSDEQENEGGPSIVVGTKVSVVVKMDKGDNAFINDVSSFGYSTVARTGTGTGTTAGVTGLAAQAQSGTADGLSWNYSYNASTKKWNMTVVDRQGTDVETMKVVGGKIQFTSAKGGTYTGPTIATGTGVTGGISLLANPKAAAVTVNGVTYQPNADANDKPINNLTGYTMTTATRTQVGTTMGLQWRFVQTDAAGDGTMYVQDAARGSDAAVPYSNWLYINQTKDHMVFDIDYSQLNNGPAVSANAKVAVVVAHNASGDIGIIDDRGNAYGGMTSVPRHDSGSIQGPDDTTVAWSSDVDVVNQVETVTFGTASDTGSHTITDQQNNLSPGDTGYEADFNPIKTIELADTGTDSGGVDILPGMAVRIVTKGHGTYTNHTPFTAVKG